jgi:omega-6 fatty acid desaturase (delta-12 desaturase)
MMGAFLGLFVATPFARWRYEHTVHHATAGDLDRRGVGDVPTITLAEYNAMSRGGRLGYRIFRNPAIMFGLGPLWGMLIEPRFVKKGMRQRVRRSILLTDLSLLLLVGGLCWWLGWQEFLLVEGPLVFLAGGAGIWLFYVQHQFDDTYWQRTKEWSFTDAGLRGSSYLSLPKVLQFFSGSIGFHHVHHLNPKIPNYRLQRAHEQNEVFHSVPRQSIWDGLRAMRLKVWDEDLGSLVSWGDRRRARALLATAAGTIR